MPDLAAYVPRCEGRTQSSMGQQTLCEPCVDCVRRTADRDGAQFIQPPQFVSLWGVLICPQHLVESDYMGDEC